MQTDSPDSQGQASVQITDEMVEAGVEELLSCSPEDAYDTPKIVVADIFRAMAKAALRCGF